MSRWLILRSCARNGNYWTANLGGIPTVEPHQNLLSIFILAQPVGSRVIRQTKTVLWEPLLVRNLFVNVLNRTGHMSASPGIVKKPCPHIVFPLFTGGGWDNTGAVECSYALEETLEQPVSRDLWLGERPRHRGTATIWRRRRQCRLKSRVSIDEIDRHLTQHLKHGETKTGKWVWRTSPRCSVYDSYYIPYRSRRLSRTHAQFLYRKYMDVESLCY